MVSLSKKISLYFVGAIFLLCFPCHVLIADPAERKSIGDDGATGSVTPDGEEQKWVGKQLVFLDILKSVDNQDYTDFRVIKAPKSKRNSEVETSSGSPVYKKFAGLTVSVTKVLSYQALSGKASSELVFLLHEPTTNTDVATVTKYGMVSHLAYADDLQIARRKWLNKKIFSKDIHLYQYNAKKGEEKIITIPCGEPLTVTDVLWGTDEAKPIWVVVTTSNGRRGYYQIAEGVAPVDALFLESEDISFFDTDPRALPGWGSSIIDNITSQRVAVGTTSEQVILSLGASDKTNKLTDIEGSIEQWVYPHQFVYLHYGVVTDIQTY